MTGKTNEIQPSTFTVYITKSTGDLSAEINTFVRPDMISDGGDGLSGIELERDTQHLAEKLGIPDSQAVEIIEHIEYAINDGQCIRSTFNAIPNNDSLYSEYPTTSLPCDWALVRNKHELGMNPEELDIYDRLSIGSKKEHVNELNSHVQRDIPHEFSIVFTDEYGQELGELPVLALNRTMTTNKKEGADETTLGLHWEPELRCHQWATELALFSEITGMDCRDDLLSYLPEITRSTDAAHGSLSDDLNWSLALSVPKDNIAGWKLDIANHWNVQEKDEYLYSLQNQQTGMKP